MPYVEARACGSSALDPSVAASTRLRVVLNFFEELRARAPFRREMATIREAIYRVVPQYAR